MAICIVIADGCGEGEQLRMPGVLTMFSRKTKRREDPQWGGTWLAGICTEEENG